MPFSGLVRYADPLHAGRHPFQTYLLALCALSGIPLLFGHTNSGSVEETLPAAVAAAWGAILCGGAVVALLGTYWPIRGDKHDLTRYATALTLERIGLAMVGPGALVYATVIVLAAHLDGLLVAAVVAAFGWAAIARMRDVGRVIARAIQISGDST